MGKAINVSGGTLTAKDHAVINNAITDSNGVAKNYGHQMNHRLDSVNKIAILDGFAMVQGRCYVIYPGDEETITIKNGSQGMKRHDLVVLEFNNSLEELKIKILNGTENPSNPVDPTLTQDDTLSGGNIYQMPLYRVVVNGLSVSIEDIRTYITIGTPIDINALKQQIMETIYPVGSIYANYANTNPNTILGFGTWTKISSTLVTSVTENVFGNGKSLSLYDGTNKMGLMSAWTGNATAFVGYSYRYGRDVGDADTNGYTMDAWKMAGVPTKTQLESDNYANSGLIVERSSVTCYLWRRTA